MGGRLNMGPRKCESSQVQVLPRGDCHFSGLESEISVVEDKASVPGHQALKGEASAPLLEEPATQDPAVAGFRTDLDRRVGRDDLSRGGPIGFSQPKFDRLAAQLPGRAPAAAGTLRPPR